MSHYQSQPEFFVDRSLGRHDVPDLLRQAGWCLRTHYEVFGDRDEQVPDDEWLGYCGQEDLPALSKDKKLRRRPTEVSQILRSKVRAFVLTSGNLKAVEQADRFIAHRASIEEASSDHAPLVYAVHADRIVHMFP